MHAITLCNSRQLHLQPPPPRPAPPYSLPRVYLVNNCEFIYRKWSTVKVVLSLTGRRARSAGARPCYLTFFLLKGKVCELDYDRELTFKCHFPPPHPTPWPFLTFPWLRVTGFQIPFSFSFFFLSFFGLLCCFGAFYSLFFWLEKFIINLGKWRKCMRKGKSGRR